MFRPKPEMKKVIRNSHRFMVVLGHFWRINDHTPYQPREHSKVSMDEWSLSESQVDPNQLCAKQLRPRDNTIHLNMQPDGHRAPQGVYTMQPKKGEQKIHHAMCAMWVVVDTDGIRMTNPSR